MSLTEGDIDAFDLSSNGDLTFRQSPDYERKPRYNVTMTAAAGDGTASMRVTVNIENLEEPGTVELFTVQPQQGTPYEATLRDDDGPINPSWQWYLGSTRGSTGAAINGADSRFCTPVTGDVGSYLRVVASYDDGYGPGNSAHAVSADRVQAALRSCAAGISGG